MEIKLSHSELYVASIVGVRRRIASISFADRHGAETRSEADAWHMDILGAQAEMAAAKALGIYWPASINAKRGDPDLLPDWQVRWTQSHSHRLIVRDSDRSDQRFVLVTGIGPAFIVHGWIRGGGAKREEWRKAVSDRSPCYMIPASGLAKFDSLNNDIGQLLDYESKGTT